MLRKIIRIDEEKCNGCGACASACHEGAIEMVNGKARLTREDYCDGLGDCLPACPTDAISFEEREAPAYNEAAVLESKQRKAASAGAKAASGTTAGDLAPVHAGCPGSRAFSMNNNAPQTSEFQGTSEAQGTSGVRSRLSQWPVQIKLVPVRAPYFDGAKLLIAADCTAFAYGNFHERFIRGHITLIGCPKLDDGDYAEKLTEIIKNNDIREVAIVRMEVPCCGGIENAAKRALMASGKFIPWSVTTISSDGRILD